MFLNDILHWKFGGENNRVFSQRKVLGFVHADTSQPQAIALGQASNKRLASRHHQGKSVTASTPPHPQSVRSFFLLRQKKKDLASPQWSMHLSANLAAKSIDCNFRFCDVPQFLPDLTILIYNITTLSQWNCDIHFATETARVGLNCPGYTGETWIWEMGCSALRAFWSALRYHFKVIFQLTEGGHDLHLCRGWRKGAFLILEQVKLWIKGCSCGVVIHSLTVVLYNNLYNL